MDSHKDIWTPEKGQWINCLALKAFFSCFSPISWKRHKRSQYDFIMYACNNSKYNKHVIIQTFSLFFFSVIKVCQVFVHIPWQFTNIWPAYIKSMVHFSSLLIELHQFHWSQDFRPPFIFQNCFWFFSTNNKLVVCTHVGWVFTLVNLKFNLWTIYHVL